MKKIVIKKLIPRIAALIVYCLVLVTLMAGTTRITSPRGGFSTKKVVKVSGVTDTTIERASMLINGIPQFVKVNNGNFEVMIVPAPGLNLIEVRGKASSDKVSFFSKAPKRDVKIVLTWDSATDVDLWVIDPKGEKCYYGHNSTASGGNLDIDITTGYGPETFTMARALPGPYSIQVQYYSAGTAPVTRVKLYVVLYEGTSKESIESYDFIMNRGSQVYHITDFVIEENE